MKKAGSAVANLSRTLSLNDKLVKKGDGESFNYFKCTICMKILYEPKQCSGCESSWCTACIDEWKKKKPYECVMRCS